MEWTPGPVTQLRHKNMQWGGWEKGWWTNRVIKTVHHGIRKQQHSSSHDEETQLAGLTHKIIRQANAFNILQNNQSGQCFLYPAALIALEHQMRLCQELISAFQAPTSSPCQLWAAGLTAGFLLGTGGGGSDAGPTLVARLKEKWKDTDLVWGQKVRGNFL